MTATVWQQFEEEGYSLGSLLTVSFLIRLLIAIVIIGYVGGRLFGATMRWIGFDVESLRPKGKS